VLPVKIFDSTVVAPSRVALVPTRKLTVASAPLGFTMAFNTALVAASEVAEEVETVGGSADSTVKLCEAEPAA
jgi:hypothetical protein